MLGDWRITHMIQPGRSVVQLIVRCPGCTDEVSVPESLRGAAVICPRCQRRFTAPDRIAPATAVAAPAPPKLPPPIENPKYCVECGAAIRRNAVICPQCGVAQPDPQAATAVNARTHAEPPRLPAPTNTNRVAAGVFGILLGCLGVHKFILGYTFEGVIMLLVTIFGTPCAALGPTVMVIVGVIEGIIYLMKSDTEFHQIYEVGHKGWF